MLCWYEVASVRSTVRKAGLPCTHGVFGRDTKRLARGPEPLPFGEGVFAWYIAIQRHVLPDSREVLVHVPFIVGEVFMRQGFNGRVQ